MALPTVEELVLPVLLELETQPASTKQMAAAIAARLTIAPDDLAIPHGVGRGTKYRNDLAWAVVWLQKAGLVQKGAGNVYALSPEGRHVVAQRPPQFGLAELHGYEGFANATKKRAPSGPARSAVLTDVTETLAPEDAVRSAMAQINERLTTDLLDAVRALSAPGFERLIVDVVGTVLASGGIQYARKHLGKTGDGGVDGVIDEDPLGIGRIYVQAKRYKGGSAVGPGEVQQFSGALATHGASKGVFVTSATFTSGARAVQEALSKTQQIRLVDGPELVEIMVRYGVGIRSVETFTIAEAALEKYVAEDQ
jgi:restriction system protein